LRIEIHIVRVLPGQIALERSIGARCFRMRTQIIAKNKVIAQRCAIVAANVEIVRRSVYGGAKGFAALDAQIPLIGVTDGRESLDRRRTSSPDGTITSTSMIGFAAKPGTAVLPTCSTATAKSCTAGQIRSRKVSKSRVHCGS
jgi:hypothetical protein